MSELTEAQFCETSSAEYLRDVMKREALEWWRTECAKTRSKIESDIQTPFFEVLSDPVSDADLAWNLKLFSQDLMSTFLKMMAIDPNDSQYDSIVHSLKRVGKCLEISESEITNEILRRFNLLNKIDVGLAHKAFAADKLMVRSSHVKGKGGI